MAKERVYMLLKKFKRLFTKQQYLTIKGQLKNGDIQGAYKGIKKIIGD